MLPKAFINHRTPSRLRIRIPSRRGDQNSLAEIGKQLSQLKNIDRVEVNPFTGSVLLGHGNVNTQAISDYAAEKGLFELEHPTQKPAEPLSHTVATRIRNVSKAVNRLSGGALDLAGAAFLLLLGVGAYQIVRGNLSAPPWYTAFWYALGISTKLLVDKAANEDNACDGDPQS
jgi:hypothetical protein